MKAVFVDTYFWIAGLNPREELREEAREAENLMRERGINEALTHDHHFEQEGFTALL
ncbi:MAG: hypothetical protein ACREBD_23290 [Blastocatellia bacterium]